MFSCIADNWGSICDDARKSICGGAEKPSQPELSAMKYQPVVWQQFAERIFAIALYRQFARAEHLVF